LKKIVLLSVGQPSTNPRLVKEANALADKGYEVSVIYSFWTRWAREADLRLFEQVTWKPILAGGSPFENKFIYFYTRLRIKFWRFISERFTLKFGIAEIARGRTYPELLKKAVSIKADLYIAHIQAALPAAVKAAQINNAKSGFDAEDFHRYEVSDDDNSFNFKIACFIEDKYLPEVNYMTASSPLIAEHYASLYNTKITTILNVFQKSNAVSINQNTDKPIRLFWFSQTIGPNRGIETIIAALKLLQQRDFELHLLGNISEKDNETLVGDLGIRDMAVYFHAPVLPAELIGFASQFDIGLASESSTPLNRDICLTNKIFTYIQAGLAIMASDTSAQVMLLNKYPAIGTIYRKDEPKSLADLLLGYYLDRKRLSETRAASLMIGQTELNWERESKKFLNIINDTLSS
jgi:glycosyltransferase involved in cell wall biosynthesis